MLTERRFEVDLLMEDPGEFTVPKFPHPGLRMRTLPPGDLSVSATSFRGWPRRSLRNMICARRRRLARPWNDLAFFHLARASRYDAILGVDPAGIAVAARINRLARRPLIYLSYELLFDEEMATAEERDIRQAERDAVKQASLFLIQDEERAAALSAELGVPRHLMELSPVAPAPQPAPSSDYLRRRFPIASDQRIVLYFGQLGAWTGRDELAEMVASWPTQFCLVLHSSSRVEARWSPDLRELIRNRRVFVSTEPVPRAELTSLVASADFGLAPYRATGDRWETGRNVVHLGLASGKVSYYALCGLPILARTLPVYEREFAQYDCGRIYRQPGDTGRILAELDSGYEHHRQEALRFYRERLNPVPGLSALIARINALAEAGASPSSGGSRAASPVHGHQLTAGGASDP
jgi:hypothetical protein